MGKYRYARANGEFITSEILERVQSVTPGFFTVDQSYDLTKTFVSGTHGDVNSFVSSQISGYAGSGNLAGWWRLNKDVSSKGSVTDSSGKGRTGTFDAVGDRPAYSTALYPSAYIQKSSYTFDASDDAINIGTAATWNAIIGDDIAAGATQKMSFAAWVYRSVAAGSARRVIDFGNYDVAVSDTPGGIQFKTVWNGSNAYWYAPTVSLSTWYHLVVTYDASSAANDPIIYLDGISQSLSESGTAPAGAWNGIKVQACYIGNSSIGTASWRGNLADVAVWNRVLTPSEVAHLYGASSNGAFREVRNFDRTSPENDTRALGINSTSRGLNTGIPADILEGFRQGVNVVNFKQLGNYLGFKIRPNSGFVTTLDKKDVSTRVFNDQISAQSLSKAYPVGPTKVDSNGQELAYKYQPIQSGSTPLTSTPGQLGARLTNDMEHRDLGQNDVYTDWDGFEPFEDTLDLDPTAIITKDPDSLVLPRQLVVQTSNELNDGAIEPLIIRKKIDGSSLEMPFYAHDVRASLGGMTDPWLRSMQIVAGWDLDEPTAGAAPFLDSPEMFATLWTTASVAASEDPPAAAYKTYTLTPYVDMPGSFSTAFATIEPFVDYMNDREKEYTTNAVSTEISDILIASGSFEDADIRTYDKMAPAGFVFDNNPIGIDSIAYGGLKK